MRTNQCKVILRVWWNQCESYFGRFFQENTTSNTDVSYGQLQWLLKVYIKYCLMCKLCFGNHDSRLPIKARAQSKSISPKLQTSSIYCIAQTTASCQCRVETTAEWRQHLKYSPKSNFAVTILLVSVSHLREAVTSKSCLWIMLATLESY